MDEFHPEAKTSKNMIEGGMGWIIIDAMDTLFLMGLKDELALAKQWVINKHTFDVDEEVSVFETTIRMLGGLLSIHHLTQDKAYLTKARDLGDRLLGAYKTDTGIPLASVNLHTKKGKADLYSPGGASSTAEVTSLQLEMRLLSHLTKDDSYANAAEKVMKVIRQNEAEGGLVPIFVSPITGNFEGHNIRLGSRGDSYYEYLAKQWLMFDDETYKTEYQKTVAGIKKHLVGTSQPGGLTYIGEKQDGLQGPLSPKMDHLVCFLPGTLALAATRGLLIDEARWQPWWRKLQQQDMDLAEELTRSCYEMYRCTKTGLAPEIVYFNTDEAVPSTTSNHPGIDIHSEDRHNLMRPETVESLFIMWRITRDEQYREWAWDIFLAFETHLHIEGGGYSSIDNVMAIPPPTRDNMESFWLAETLKYLYLIFSDDESTTSLDKIVFNTEAHILPILPKSPKTNAAPKVEATIEEKALAAHDRALSQGKTEAQAQDIQRAVLNALQEEKMLKKGHT